MTRLSPAAGLAAVCLWFIPALALAQDSAASLPSPGAEPFAITDNSFLVEEAFNQERGVVQNIFTWSRDKDDGWESTFTQEWPVPAMRHQLSYTIVFGGTPGDGNGFGAALLNYRFQVTEESATRPAFAPRVSLVLPTGRRFDDSDRPGLQINLPVSKQFGDLYLHGNAGVTWLHAVPTGAGRTAEFSSPLVAGSAIWRARQMLNLMLEVVESFDDSARGDGTHGRDASTTISPGVRGGWNFGDRQLVIGLAVPVTRQAGETGTAVLGYFSWEAPFTKTK